MTWVSRQQQIVKVMIRVSPNAKRNGIEGIWNGTHIKMALSAPPIDGKANQMLIDFLSDKVGIRCSAVEVVSGQTSRLKCVQIHCPNETKAIEVEHLFLNLSVK